MSRGSPESAGWEFGLTCQLIHGAIFCRFHSHLSHQQHVLLMGAAGGAGLWCWQVLGGGLCLTIPSLCQGMGLLSLLSPPSTLTLCLSDH